VTTSAFLDFASLRDLADLPPRERDEDGDPGLPAGHSTATIPLEPLLAIEGWPGSNVRSTCEAWNTR
jgi:hypothetical protein